MSELILQLYSGLAGASDLVAHTFGKLDLAAKRIVTCGAGEQADGVIHDDYSATRGATLEIEGFPLRVKVGDGGVTAGHFGMSDADGAVVEWTAGNFPTCRVWTTVAEGALAEVEIFDIRTFSPQANIAALVNNTAGVADGTLEAIANPGDAPASADALRDDLVANALPAIRNNLTELKTTLDAVLAVLVAQKLTL